MPGDSYYSRPGEDLSPDDLHMVFHARLRPDSEALAKRISAGEECRVVPDSRGVAYLIGSENVTAAVIGSISPRDYEPWAFDRATNDEGTTLVLSNAGRAYLERRASEVKQK